VIVPSIEVKLKDYPDAGYVSTNNPPQGEIWLRGGSVTQGSVFAASPYPSFDPADLTIWT
jgi:hypothetical protein